MIKPNHLQNIFTNWKFEHAFLNKNDLIPPFIILLLFTSILGEEEGEVTLMAEEEVNDLKNSLWPFCKFLHIVF